MKKYSKEWKEDQQKKNGGWPQRKTNGFWCWHYIENDTEYHGEAEYCQQSDCTKMNRGMGK